jgi:hypothetical protein
MISTYLNQTITLKVKGAVNTYNEPTYTSSSIKARFEYKRKLVRNSKGESVISEATCFTQISIKVGDIITYDSIDWVVIGVNSIVGLDGSISHYEAVL